ncbi:MAG: deoxyribonuclease IV [candidate division Zixibacteria bacterium]|nr:deoxyribonuclease IV [candidate division Zixibacteria bacterium]
MLFGAHESIAGGVHKSIERGKQATCDTIQIFNKSNSQWRAAKLKSEDIDEYFRLQEKLGVTVATSHTSYLINIASPNEALEEKSILSLKEEMERCKLLNIPNLVMHPGSHVGSGEEEGMIRISRNINKLFDALNDNSVTLLLESTAGQGTNIGYLFEQLAQIIHLVEDKNHIGVCLDTCHIFSAGYELRNSKGYSKTIKDFDDIIGLEKLRIIHMNDSKKPFGEKKDRHEHIGQGYIGLEGFSNIVNDSRLKKIPMILETPKDKDLAEDIENLKVLRSLIRK